MARSLHLSFICIPQSTRALDQGGVEPGKLSALKPLGHGRYRFATASATMRRMQPSVWPAKASSSCFPAPLHSYHPSLYTMYPGSLGLRLTMRLKLCTMDCAIQMEAKKCRLQIFILIGYHVLTGQFHPCTRNVLNREPGECNFLADPEPLSGASPPRFAWTSSPSHAGRGNQARTFVMDLAGSKAMIIHSAKNCTRCSVSPRACASIVALAVSGVRWFRRYSFKCRNLLQMA